MKNIKMENKANKLVLEIDLTKNVSQDFLLYPYVVTLILAKHFLKLTFVKFW